MEGSSKQVAWALRIRADILDAGKLVREGMIRSAEANSANLGPVLGRGLDLLDELLERIEAVESAGWIIQHRPLFPLCGRKRATMDAMAQYLARIDADLS